jgi:membrane protein YqaA with SNARE-associated domain
LIRFVASALEFGHNIGIRRCVARLHPFAERWWFPPLAAALAAAATLSLAVPVGPVLIALVALNPRRWRAVVVSAVLGSVVAGTLGTHLVGHYGMAWIDRQLPQLAGSKHWHYLVDWAASYGFLTLAAVAASPFAQTPALILAAMLGMKWPTVFGALLLGKGLKYALIGAATARATRVDDPPMGGDAMATQGNERGVSR